MDYSEIITNGCFTLVLILILYSILELLFYYIGGEYKENRVQEEKFKTQKEKVFNLRKTSHRRGIRWFFVIYKIKKQLDRRGNPVFFICLIM